MERGVRAIASALSIFLLGPVATGHVHAAITEGYLANPSHVSNPTPSRPIQLAGSFHQSPNKLGDKFLSGKSGGRLGIGGTESKIFPKKKVGAPQATAPGSKK